MRFLATSLVMMPLRINVLPLSTVTIGKPPPDVIRIAPLIVLTPVTLRKAYGTVEPLPSLLSARLMFEGRVMPLSTSRPAVRETLEIVLVPLPAALLFARCITPALRLMVPPNVLFPLRVCVPVPVLVIVRGPALVLNGALELPEAVPPPTVKGCLPPATVATVPFPLRPFAVTPDGVK